MWSEFHQYGQRIVTKQYVLLVLMIFALSSCGSKKNVIQGKVTYIDDLIQVELPAEGVQVYLYQSIVVFQDQPNAFDKVVTAGPSGYYSLFPLQDGPYYVYSEKLDTNGLVLYSTGSSVNVEGSETKLLDLFLH